jgi:neutral ceramidase
VDFSRVEIPADLAGGESGHRTASASIGARMLQGTAEGTGVPPLAGALLRQLSRAACARERLAARFLPEAARREVFAKFRAQGNKAIFLDMGEGKMLGSKGLVLAAVPGWVDQTVGHIKAMHRRRLTGEGPWTPNVLPVQLFILGELAIAGVPGELTTQSGRRLRKLLLDTLAPRGVTRVVSCCYANAYAGYITTPEEYDCQHYEGASTHFGRWTQPAYMAKFRELALELLKPEAERRLDTGVQPRQRTPEELRRLVHDERPSA